MIIKMLKIRYQNDQAIEMGIDEAGRGCLWGPIYAAAVIWAPEDEWTDEHREIAPQIKDSKKLSEKKRDHLATAILSLAIDYGVGSVSAQEIDENGMSYANRQAFKRAINAGSIVPDRVLVDGILAIEENWLKEKEITESVMVIDGDATYLPIAAASILAKTAHDQWVKDYLSTHADLEDKYNLLSCKGYGTEKHRAGILKHGAEQEHRRLFLRKLLNQTCMIQDD
jgi:ribonuclease HII